MRRVRQEELDGWARWEAQGVECPLVAAGQGQQGACCVWPVDARAHAADV